MHRPVPLLAPSLAWFASGALLLPAIALNCGAFLAVTRYALRGRQSDLAGYALCLAGALCFYSKSVVVAPAALCLCLALHVPGTSWRVLLGRAALVAMLSALIGAVYALIAVKGNFQPAHLPVPWPM